MLKPDASIMVGLSVAGVVFAVHSQATPSQADIQALPPGTQDIDASERKATILSVGIVSGISLIAKDPTVFLIGSVATLAMAFWTRHSNWKDTSSGIVGGVSQAGSPNTTPEATVAETTPYTMYSGANDFVGQATM